VGVGVGHVQWKPRTALDHGADFACTRVNTVYGAVPVAMPV